MYKASMAAQKKTPQKKTPQRLPRIAIEVAPRRKGRYERAAELEELHVSEWARRVLDDAADLVLQKHGNERSGD